MYTVTFFLETGETPLESILATGIGFGESFVKFNQSTMPKIGDIVEIDFFGEEDFKVVRVTAFPETKRANVLVM